MNNPVVFLDIDGVLNCYEDVIKDAPNVKIYWEKGMRDVVNTIKLQLLIDFLKDIDGKVIGVSSWFRPARPDITPEEISQNWNMIRFLGLEDYMLGISAHTGGGLGRGKEVLRIVEQYKYKDWVVIDDAGNTMYSFDTHQINGRTGLTKEDLEILKQRLKEGKH